MGFPSHYEEPPGQYPIPVQDQHQVFLSQFRLQAGEQPGEFSVVGCFMAAVRCFHVRPIDEVQYVVN